MSERIATGTNSETPALRDGSEVLERSGRFRGLTAPLLITILGLALYLPGIGWGMPSTTSWSQDTIAAYRTIGAVEGWPHQWKGRYPPLHYLLLRSAYEPTLQYWERTGQRIVDPRTGNAELKQPHAPKVGLLILIARLISVAMAIAAGLGVFASTKRLVSDDLAGLAAAAALMSGAAFTYFAHLGNVDIPSTCWLAWSVYFYIRALDSRLWTDCLLLGLLASLAACTKDAVAAFYPGMAIVLLVHEALRQGQARTKLHAFVSALWQPRWLVGLAAFAVPYMIISGLLFDPEGYLLRMKYWVTPASDSILAGEYRYPNQLRLLLASFHFAAGGVGWPMLAAMIVAVGYALRKHARVTFVLLVPAVVYYALVIAQIEFVYARFLFVPLVPLSILLGLATAALLRNKRLALGIRWGIPAIVLLLSISYAAAVDAEMRADSRYRAEAWFVDNVELSASVGAFSKQQYLPRLAEMGYATYSVTMARESFEKPQPDYLVLSRYNYEDFNAKQRACVDDLLSGRLGYRIVATFTGQYLGAESSWLGLAGWGAPVPGKISPLITVLRRIDH